MKYRIVEVQVEGSTHPYYVVEEKFLLWWLEDGIFYFKDSALEYVKEQKCPPKVTEKIIYE